MGRAKASLGLAAEGETPVSDLQIPVRLLLESAATHAKFPYVTRKNTAPMAKRTTNTLVAVRTCGEGGFAKSMPPVNVAWIAAMYPAHL